MAEEFNRTQFLEAMSTAVEEKNNAVTFAESLIKQGLERIVFVACGASNREMGVIKYWVERSAANLDCRIYFPAELMAMGPPIFTDKTLVIFGSHSGTTPETVQAAQFLNKYPCTTVAITQSVDSPLAQSVHKAFLYGKSPDEGYQHGYYSFFLIAMGLVSALMNQLEDWPFHNDILIGLDNFPKMLADTMDFIETRVTEEARLYHNDRTFYLVGSGPMSCTTYVTGICVLMEMQWLHTCPFESAEFFHGPFEIIDRNTPLIILLGEDPSRPLTERVVRFCKKHTERLMIYDSKDFEMPGFPPSVRQIFAPFVLQSAFDRFAEHLAVWHDHPLVTRRYMWRSEY